MKTLDQLLPWPFNTGYLVHSDGYILSLRGKPMSPSVQRGRGHVQLKVGNKYLTRRVAVVVCETFHGPRPDGKQTAHLDGNSLNDRADNLAWKTAKENIADKSLHGTQVRGADHPASKLKEADVREMRQFHAAGASNADLVKMFGVNPGTVSNIVNRKRWKHVK